VIAKNVLIVVSLCIVVGGGLGIYQTIRYFDRLDDHYDFKGGYSRNTQYTPDNASFNFRMTIIDIEETEHLENLDFKLLVDNNSVCHRNLLELERNPYEGRIRVEYLDNDSNKRLSLGDGFSISGDNSSYVEVFITFNRGVGGEVFHFRPEDINGKIADYSYEGLLPDLTLSDIRLYGVENVEKNKIQLDNKTDPHEGPESTVEKGFILLFNLTNNGLGDAYDIKISWKIDGLDNGKVSDLDSYACEIYLRSVKWGLGYGGSENFTITKLQAGKTVCIFIEPLNPAWIQGINLTNGSTHEIKIFLDPQNKIPETDERNNNISSNVYLYYEELPGDVYQPSQISRWDNTEIGVAGGTGFFILSLLALLFISTDIGKWKMIPLLVPLYARIKGRNVLDQFTRGQIYGIIRETPGTSYSHIKEILELGNGTLLYHLSVLEREGFIKTGNRGIKKLFYPAKLSKRDRDLEEKFPKGEDITELSILNSFQKELIDLVKNKTKLREIDISRETGCSRQKVNYNVKQLKKRGILQVNKGFIELTD